MVPMMMMMMKASTNIALNYEWTMVLNGSHIFTR